MAQAESVTVREFVTGALARVPTATELAKRMGGPLHQAYAEGVVGGTKEALEHVLKFIEQEDQRGSNGSSETDVAYDWRERRIHFDGAPDGMCWSVRQMYSYGTDLERFIPHLQAMAEGLERAHFTEYDAYPGIRYDADDNYGIFVVGLRPSTPDDKTEAQREKERKERDERETLVRLAAKYPDALTAGGSNGTS